ncbi:hypothetical protein VitviT2T_028621 [Vitis vinifera]|uniref:Fe2OG dioxygenase domain-containing protein n=3 Tax=Vitis vinifera TaxID=29760 RepID=A0ABY9DTV4_VITVI|nr:hypothetical protein VitviT2T_028621 [Vitis vinifera]
MRDIAHSIRVSHTWNSFSAVIPSGCLTLGIPLRRHSIRVSHTWNSFSAAIPSGCLTSGILPRRRSTFLGYLASGILSANVPPSSDISHPESCPPTMEDEGNLNKFRVGPHPTLFYIPDFITDYQQTQLLNNIYQAPVSKWKSLKNRRLQNWGGVVHEKGLLSQDLPTWLTRITERIFEESGLFPSAINHVLINEYLPNQGIMPHQDGPAYFPVVAILSLGSPVVMDFTPHSRLRLDTNDAEDKNSDDKSFEIETKKWLDDHHPFSILLMPRSLLIFKDEMFSEYLHGIKDSEVQQYDKVVNDIEALEQHRLDPLFSGSEKAVEVMRNGELRSIQRTTTRISLTCRLVLKVHKNLFKF